jgi:ubiquinone/menaquinone biosynthesis C-methylase UbiE
MCCNRTTIQTSYDTVAKEYADQFFNEMERKPFDRKMLDWLSEKVNGRGPICDLGCGPGQIARYLHSKGIETCGIDWSTEMINHARRINPSISFNQGDMMNLVNVTDNTYGGIAAFYSIIHIPRTEVIIALKEINRVLCPQGVLLLTFHVGKETLHLDEWWGKKISADFNFFETREMRILLNEAGFIIQEAIERDPYPELEYQSRRAYIFSYKQ